MKIAIFSILALAIGIAAGMYTSYREFDGERLPTKMTLAVLAEKATVGSPGEGPKVVVEGGEIHDFGTMDRGSKGKHDFVFRNVGTKPLEITMGETTCKCTAMSVGGKAMSKGSKQTIAAGDSFTVTLEWAIKIAQPSFSQSAEFTTTDPRRETVRLLIHGRTVDAIELAEPSLLMRGISSSEPAFDEMAIFSHRDEPLQIVKHTWLDESSKDFLEATFTPISSKDALAKGAKGGVMMRISVKPGLPLGINKQLITLKTNYQGLEPQTVPVEVQIVGDITLLGSNVPAGTTTIALGTVDQKVGKTHTVYLLIKGPHRDMTDVEIVKVEPASLLAKLEAPLADSPTVKRIPIKIEVPAGSPQGNYLGTDNSKVGKIIVTTTHPQIKQIEIPVFFLVR